MKFFSRLPVWAISLLAAILGLPLVSDRLVPGPELHWTAEWLGLSTDPSRFFSLWGAFVSGIGRDLRAISGLSLAAAVIDVALVALALRFVFAAVRRHSGTKAPSWTDDLSTLLAAMAFFYAPGFLFAATHPSPLMVELVPILAAFALAVCGALRVRRSAPPDADKRMVRIGWRLDAPGWAAVAGALVLFAFAAYELGAGWGAFLGLLLLPLGTWLLCGLVPALAVAWGLRRGWLNGSPARLIVFTVWGVGVAALAFSNYASGRLERGELSEAIVSRIAAGAQSRVAVALDGKLDDLLAFRLPDDVRRIDLSRSHDPAYAADFAAWAEQTLPSITTNRVDDLIFAAYLGPTVLLDVWTRRNRNEMESAILTPLCYLPSEEVWNASVADLERMGANDSLAAFWRKTLAVCGNGIGVRLLSENADGRAWRVLRKAQRIDPKNGAVLANLYGMLQRGYAAPKDEAQAVRDAFRDFGTEKQSLARIGMSIATGGGVYRSAEEREKREEAERQVGEKLMRSPEVRRLFEALVQNRRDVKALVDARQVIAKTIGNGVPIPVLLSSVLMSMEFICGEKNLAERDARMILSRDLDDPGANAVMGSICGIRGDHRGAERHLRRSLRSGKAPVAAKHDLATSLLAQGRAAEAEPFAREAVKIAPNVWLFHETLAEVLKELGKTEEAERERAESERLKAAHQPEKQPEAASSAKTNAVPAKAAATDDQPAKEAK